MVRVMLRIRTCSVPTEVCVIDEKKLFNKQFQKERNLSDYIEQNIIKFCVDVLDDVYLSHEKEVQADKHNRFQPRQPRIDYKIKCQNHTYLVELKNPKNTSENRHSIGQMLSYSVLLDDEDKFRMVVITTKHDMLTAKAIKKFNLPIRYVYFEKGKIMEYLRD